MKFSLLMFSITTMAAIGFDLESSQASVHLDLSLDAVAERAGPFLNVDTVPDGGVSLGQTVTGVVNNGLEEYQAGGSAFLEVSPSLRLGALALASGTSTRPGQMFSPTSQASARVLFQDKIFLVGTNLPGSLTLHFLLESTVVIGGPAASGFVSLRSGSNSIGGGGELISTIFVNGGAANYDIDLRVSAQAQLGFASADASHTVHLTSITLPNGKTPESEGISLRFESGATSPNLAAVTPEPFSLIVWVGLIAATVVSTGRRVRS